MTRRSPGDAPCDYFSPDQWPHGTAREGTPDEVYWAAELANYVQRLAWERGDTLAAGLAKLAADTGLNASTLRFVADGQRWTTLRLVAQLESRTQQRATGWDLVAGRLKRGHSADPAVPPARKAASGRRGEESRVPSPGTD